MIEVLKIEEFNGIFATAYEKEEGDLEAFALKGEESEMPLCPFTNGGSAFLLVTLDVVESNLNIYHLCISGCDDAEAAKDFLSLEEAYSEIKRLKKHGIAGIFDRDYYSY